MLKLKKLQILGFKSFCDRTELNFTGDGISAIVGPNGCGKSNISDAVSWVLGEQSAKTLRGTQMMDVIFAGTRDRKATGMAEVTLTLVDPDVYQGEVTEPEIEVRDNMPSDYMNADDWDETALRAEKAAEVEAYSEEVQPGIFLDGEAREDGSEPEAPRQDEAHEAAAAEAHTGPDLTPHTEAQPGEDGKVVLKIRRRKFQARFKAGEIAVTRRLFRSGDSEYLLNGKLCRLRDIQDIFMGTGLGPESYAIIEQGRIGQILSSKPHDRRAIIEEAAGITRYKTRKRLAEARLEQAKLNLSRINDIFDEVTKQMNSLKRQAAKAERYAKLREEMRAKLRVVLASKFAVMSAEATVLQAEIEQLTEALRVNGESVLAKDAEHAGRTQRGYAIETEAKETVTRLSHASLEIDRSTARQRTNEERCAELVARSAAAQAEIERNTEQIQRLERELSENRGVLESAAADVAAAQQEAQARQQEAGAAAIALRDTEHNQERLRNQVLHAMAQAGGVRNQIAQAEEHIASLDRESDRLQREHAAAMADVEAFGGKRGQITFEFENVTQTVNALGQRISEVRGQIHSKREQEADARRQLDGLRAAHAAALGKKQSLEAVIAEHGYSTESVKRLFQSGALSGGLAPAGVLADFLEVDGQYERVVEDFLRDELNYVVVKSWDSAEQGLQMLRGNVDGRATFLVHPNDSQARFPFTVDESTRAPQRGAVVPVKDALRVLDGFGKSLEVILPKLRDGYITPDAGTARDLALENPDAYFLAPNGETFHNVTVTGGKQRMEGPLSLKRELRDVLRAISEYDAEMRHLELKVLTLGREAGELTGILQSLETERREAERQAMSSSHALQQLETELQRTGQRLNTYRLEIERVGERRREKEALAAAKRGEAALHEQHKEHFEQELSCAQERVMELRSARDAAAQAASEVSARVAALEERHRSAAASVGRIERLASEISSRLHSLLGQIEGATAEKAQREQENLELAEKLIVLAAEKQAAEERSAELQAESGQVRARIAEIESEIKELRSALDAARDRRGEIAAAHAKLDSDMAYMAETCLNELSVPADELRSDAGITLLDGDILAAEDAAHKELRARLDNMGPVNMMALEEYEETAQRHAFLETQRKDLLDSIENTQSTIKEIDTISRQQFEVAFQHINENFQVTFKKLFGGGQAFMRLTDEENTAESGIDIVASPPGKKLQNVLLLSGGEKALTALSLLVGIFQYAPSPFCILDEVDAPLDEANVGRFTELIREMSGKTQFIIITHSKRTMSVAPTMYGVTMQEPGVSKVVSVRFGDPARAATA